MGLLPISTLFVSVFGGTGFTSWDPQEDKINKDKSVIEMSFI